MPNFLEHKPNEHAVKTQWGWQDKRTGEHLVSAFGAFKSDTVASDKPNQGKPLVAGEEPSEDQETEASPSAVTFVPEDTVTDTVELSGTEVGKDYKIGTITNSTKRVTSIELEPVSGEVRYTVELVGNGNIPKGTNSQEVKVTIKRKDDTETPIVINTPIVVKVGTKKESHSIPTNITINKPAGVPGG